ncbi:MAG TPA: hypothetical protein DEA08_09935 [Planctomycetes bacterium]|nr:hypothetical protein [Planctomycetota bacterium]
MNRLREELLGDPGATWAQESQLLVAVQTFERADMALRLAEGGQLELAREVAEVAMAEAAVAGREGAWVAFLQALEAELELKQLLERERSPAEHERFEALLAQRVARAQELASARGARLAAGWRSLALRIGILLLIAIVLGLVITKGGRG